MQLMIAMPEPAASRLSELFASIGFPEERGRAQRIASKFGVSRETVRKWLAGGALPETSRLAEMVRGSPYTVDYILTGRDQKGSESPALEVAESPSQYGTPGQRLITKLAMAINAGHIDDRMIRVINAMIDTLIITGR